MLRFHRLFSVLAVSTAFLAGCLALAGPAGAAHPARFSNDPAQRADPGFRSGNGSARIGGKITDEAGKPLIGLEVKLAFAQNQGLIHAAKTGKKGDFSFVNLGSGLWYLSVSGGGYEPAKMSVAISQVGANPPIRLKLRKLGDGAVSVIEDAASLAELDKARRLMDEGRFAEALPSLTAVLAKNPADQTVRLALGDCRRETGDFKNAETDYEAILGAFKADPASAKSLASRAMAGLGSIRIQEGRAADAGAYFRQAAELVPGDEALAFTIGEVCYAAKAYEEAAAYYGLAAKIKPDWPDPLFRLGYVRVAQNANTEAASLFERFLTLEPQGERADSVRAILPAIKKQA